MIDMIKKTMATHRPSIIFIVYCMVGVASALVDISSLKLMNEYLHMSAFYSITAAYILGLLVNYFLHNAVTFKTTMSKSSFLRYLTIVALNYALTIVMIFLLQKAGLSLIWSKVFTMPVISVSGFIFSKLWIYKVQAS